MILQKFINEIKTTKKVKKKTVMNELYKMELN